MQKIFNLNSINKQITLSLVVLLLLSLQPAQSSKPIGTAGQYISTSITAKSNQFWWPEQLDLSALRDHDQRSNPYGEDF